MTPTAPFSITAFVPLSRDVETIWSSAGIAVPPDRPDTLLESAGPTCWIDLPVELCSEGGIRLAFNAADDFSPEALLSRQPYLVQLQQAAEFFAVKEKGGPSQSDIDAFFSQNPQLPEYRQPFLPDQGDDRQDDAGPTLDNLLSMVDIGEETEIRRQKSGKQFYLDTALKILELIFQNPSFKTLESTRLGLELLCRQVTDKSGIALSVIPTTPDNLEETLTHHRESLIENPPDLLLFDSPVTNSAASLTLLDFLVDFTDTLMTPGLAWLEPLFFRLESWKEIDRLSFLPHTLDNPEFGQFRKIRSLPGSSWFCLCCNRVIGRDGYRARPLGDSISFTEPGPTWISPVWAIAALIARRICTTGRPTGMAGRRNSIRIPSAAGAVTETIFPEERIDQFSRCGIVPIAAALKEDSVFIADTTMLSGSCSLGQQFLTASLIHLLLFLHDTQEIDSGAFNLAPRISEELGTLLKTRYRTDPGTIKVKVEGSSSIEGTPLHISWTPAEKILPAARPIAFDFLWNPG